MRHHSIGIFTDKQEKLPFKCYTGRLAGVPFNHNPAVEDDRVT